MGTLTLRTWSLAKTDETTTTYYGIRIIAKCGEIGRKRAGTIY